jgi:hypothetical protein
MASRFRSNQNIDLPAGTSGFLDFAPANFTNPSTLQLQGCIITRAGVSDANDANLTPNIDETALVSNWGNNIGLANTYVGGVLEITAASATVISDANWHFVAGTWTPSQLQHFDEPSNGQLRHIGTTPRNFSFVSQLSVSGTGNDTVNIRVRKYDSSTTTTSTEVVQTRVINNAQGGGSINVGYYTILTSVVLDQNDYLFLEAQNVSTNNITVMATSTYQLSER